MCAFPRPAESSCVLLKHREVKTLFHGAISPFFFDFLRLTTYPTFYCLDIDFILTLHVSELGHGVHDLVSQTRYIRFHGTRMPKDMVETMSILLENWCWMKDILREMSCHYTTLKSEYLAEWKAQEQNHGKPHPPVKIPDHVLEGIIRPRNQHRRLTLLHQM